MWMDRVRIATYNVQNLFLCGEGAPKPPAQVRALVRMIRLVDADVLMLQEVGSQASLDALNERLEVAYPHATLLPGHSNRSIHLGVLSRQPVKLTSLSGDALTNADGAHLRHHASAEDAEQGILSDVRVQRDVLLCEVQAEAAPDGVLALVGVHLKSRTNPPWQVLASDEVRAAESRRIAEVVGVYRAQHPSRALILLGDFNDLSVADALSPLDALDLVDCHAVALRNAAVRRNPSTYWPKRAMRIDRLLLSEDTARRVVPGSTQIHAGRMGREASDHFPVSLELDWTELDWGLARKA